MNDDRQPRPPKGDFYEETLREHRECMEVVSDLETCLGRQPDREGVWLGQVVEKLGHLGATLREHFLEEHDGLYVQLPVKFPRLAARLTKLKAEHATILETLERTLGKARRLGEPELYDLRELNAHAQLLVATIRRHEAEENEIIIEAHWDEVGVGD